MLYELSDKEIKILMNWGDHYKHCHFLTWSKEDDEMCEALDMALHRGLQIGLKYAHDNVLKEEDKPINKSYTINISYVVNDGYMGFDNYETKTKMLYFESESKGEELIKDAEKFVKEFHKNATITGITCLGVA